MEDTSATQEAGFDLQDLDEELLLSELAAACPDLADPRVTMLFDYLDQLDMPRREPRIDGYGGQEKSILWTLAGMRLAVDHRLFDLRHVTVNLHQAGPEKVESADDAIKTIGRNLKPALGDMPFLWWGIHVPARISGEPQQAHLHLVVALPLDDGKAAEALDRCRVRRNRNKERSVHEKEVFDPAGLLEYWSLKRNLGVKGARPIACQPIKSRCGEMIETHIQAEISDLRDDLADAVMMGDSGRPGEREHSFSPVARALLAK